MARSIERPVCPRSGWQASGRCGRHVAGRGRLPAGWSLDLAQEGGPIIVVTGATGESRVRVSGVDRRAQEDSRLVGFDGSGPGLARISAPQPLGLTRGSHGELHLIVDYRVDQAPARCCSVSTTPPCRSPASCAPRSPELGRH